ncbi:MAG: DUF4835 family protein [Flavobacteriales bacterium]|nr:DUF4835 family protein [Flavobacteriales bacterium]
MNKLTLLFLLLFLNTSIWAQEFNCVISVNADRIEGTNKQRFETLQTSLIEFMNSTVWTEYNYEVEERIDVTLTMIIMQEASADQFTATIQVQSRRPIYGTDYNSPTYNYKDSKFQFKYIEHEPLVFNEQNFTSNLVSTMSFYAYLMLGIDADTFKEKDGTEYFEKARKVVEFAQNQGYSGWEANSSRANRYWIIENLLADTYSDARIASYQYHRLGLDVMSKNSAVGKSQIFESIKKLEGVAKSRPNANIVQNFMDAKVDEIVEIFSAGPSVNIEELRSALNTISPTNQANWNKLK